MVEVVEYRSWIKDWQKLVDNPSQFITSFSVRNITDYLIPTLKKLVKEQEVNPTSYEISLLKTLFGLIKNKNPEVEVLHVLEPYALKKTSGLLNPIHLDRLHIQELLRQLQRLNNACHDSRFPHTSFSLISNYLINKNNYHDKVIPLTENLIHHLLSNYSLQYVKQLPRRVFANSFFESVRKEVLNEVIRNQDYTIRHLRL